MTDKPEKKSHPWTWTLSLVMALPLLYLLGRAPLEVMIFHFSPVVYATNPVLNAVFTPHDWLREQGPLKGMMEAYESWWWHWEQPPPLITPHEPAPGVGGASR